MILEGDTGVAHEDKPTDTLPKVPRLLCSDRHKIRPIIGSIVDVGVIGSDGQVKMTPHQIGSFKSEQDSNQMLIDLLGELRKEENSVQNKVSKKPIFPRLPIALRNNGTYLHLNRIDVGKLEEELKNIVDRRNKGNAIVPDCSPSWTIRKPKWWISLSTSKFVLMLRSISSYRIAFYKKS